MTNLTHYEVPQWVASAFLLLIPLPFVLLLHFIWREAKQHALRQAFPLSLLFFVLYVGYVMAASLLGWFDQVLFPPKVLLMSTFPYAFLLFGLLPKTKSFQLITEHAAVDKLIQLHIFRVIGSFFIILALYNALPPGFAYIAGFGDLITAISSVFVAQALRQKKSYAHRLAVAWNLFGAVDILFTAIAANALTKISIDTGAMGVDTLAFFPFSLIPAFAPPTILMLHWVIYQKLHKK